MTDSRPLLPVARPIFGEAEAAALRRVLRSGWVTQGPEVAAFEREFAAFAGARHACAVASCTAALHLALRALGVGPGDEVVTVSHSFIATANAVRSCSAVPIFLDIEAIRTFNMDPMLLAKVITSRTRAIVCVHQMGMPCDLPAILKIARERRVPVIEDAACAAGSQILWNGVWERIGKPHGVIACFSFHPRKLLTTGEGGMLTTADPALDRRFRLLRQHGMSVSDVTRHSSRRLIAESYMEVGYNYRMSDLQASVGRVQLRRLGRLVSGRRKQADRYMELLGHIPGLGLPHESSWARSNWQSFCIELPDRVDQGRFMRRALDAGVATRRGVMCAHREPAYDHEPWSCRSGRRCCACPGGRCRRLSRSERAQDRGVILPLYPEMTPAEQDRVARVILENCPR